MLRGEVRSCHAATVPGRDRDSEALRAVAPLVAVVGGSHQLVGAVTLVEHGGKTMGVTSAELLRPHATAKLRVLTALDGSKHVDVMGIGMGRYAGLGLLELAKSIPDGEDVKPLTLDHVCATSDTRGAPAGILTIVPVGDAFQRVLVAVHVDADDGAGMTDLTHIASPIEAVEGSVEGSPVFAWFPPNPALARPGEVLVVAIAHPYRARIAQPRSLPVIAELVALDDLGRALISKQAHDAREDPAQISGEIVDPTGPPDPLAGLDE
jgi:hypothetical protein